MTNEQAMKLAIQLREHCKEQTSCETCVFGIKPTKTTWGENAPLSRCALESTPYEYKIDTCFDVYLKNDIMEVECIVAGLTDEERKQNVEHQKQWLIKNGAEIIKVEATEKQIVITYKI